MMKTVIVSNLLSWITMIMILILMSMSSTLGFLPVPSIKTQDTVRVIRAAEPWNSLSLENPCLDEYGEAGLVSRRVAMIVTATAALTTTTPTTAAAASATANLKRIVTKLERDYRDQVNTKGASEKHIPQVSIDQDSLTVSIPHVMDPEKPHYIEYIWLMMMQEEDATQRVVAVQAFQATDPSPPTLIVQNIPSPGQYIPMAYCNLHGLWRGEAISI